MYLGDFNPSATVYRKFLTRSATTGAPTALSSGAISVYKDGSTTQSTTGVTLTADFDSVTGLNHVAIDTSADGTFYSAGSEFAIVITTGTVSSVSVVGAVVGQFSINNRSALRPTTAGRTLDVSAGGEAGVDWANVGSPTTTNNLSGTTVKTATDVETDTQDIQSRLPAALTAGGNIKADALAISGDSVAADNAESFFDGTGYAGTGNVIPTVTTTGTATNVTTVNGLAAGVITASSIAADAITAAKIATGAVDADALAADAANEIADALLDRSNGVETSVTPRGALRAILATTTGVITDAATTTNTFKNPAGDTTRVTATVESDGDRTAVTLNV